MIRAPVDAANADQFAFTKYITLYIRSDATLNYSDVRAATPGCRRVVFSLYSFPLFKTRRNLWRMA